MVRFATNAGTDRHLPTNVSTMSFTSGSSAYGVGRRSTFPPPAAPVAPTFAGSTALVSLPMARVLVLAAKVGPKRRRGHPRRLILPHVHLIPEDAVHRLAKVPDLLLDTRMYRCSRFSKSATRAPSPP